jgi:YfiH family protein
MLVSPLMEQLDWIEHGFGTRAAPLSQDGMASLKQIHSAVCLVAGAAGCAETCETCIGEGDALITNRVGVAVSVRTADCYPILLADPVTRSVAAVHAGWRGTAAGVVQETIARMRLEFGTRPEDLWAAIGPGIGACCYEVGEEVARKFGRDSAGRIDLAAANRRQLLEAGVVEERVHALGLCTYCDAERFHSYRRDKSAAGRMISYIRLLHPARD